MCTQWIGWAHEVRKIAHFLVEFIEVKLLYY